jgi:hypothetical protein
VREGGEERRVEGREWKEGGGRGGKGDVCIHPSGEGIRGAALQKCM